MKSKWAALTLIELLFALTLVVVMSSLALPSLFSFWFIHRQKIASSELLQAVQLVRSTAMSRGESVALCKSNDGKTCGGEWHQGYLIHQGEQALYYFPQKLPGQLHWRAFGVHDQELVFLPTGLPDAGNGTFWYCEVHAHVPAWALVINRSGRARLIYSETTDEIGQSLKCG